MPKLEEFSEERFHEEPMSAHKFLAFIEASSYKYLPEDWYTLPNDRIIDAATNMLYQFSTEILLASECRRHDGLQ